MSLCDEDAFGRWLRQGEDTLRSAESDLKNGRFNWACFKCQQAAEYATKAALRGLGRSSSGPLSASASGRTQDIGLGGDAGAGKLCSHPRSTIHTNPLPERSSRRKPVRVL